MKRFNSCIVTTVALLMVFGIFFVVGCGGSAEQQKLTTLIQEYNQVVEDYANAVEGNDNGKLTALESKVKEYMTAWVTTKSEMMDAITPQVLDQLDNEYQKITKKFENLAKS